MKTSFLKYFNKRLIYKMSDILDKIEQICRVCLLEELPLFSLLHKIDVNEDIPKMLNCCTNINIDLNDNLPQLICSNCLQRLESAYTFKQECEKSDAILRKLIKENEKNLKIKADKTCKTFIVEESQNYSDCESTSLSSSELIKTEIEEEEVSLNVTIELDTVLTDSNSLSAFKTINGKIVKHVQNYKCQTCQKTFREHTKFWKHREKHHMYYRCYVCWKQFPNTDLLQKHGEEHQNKIYNCNLENCIAEFDNFQLFIFHKKNDHGIKNYLQCSGCHLSFTGHEKWDIHIQNHLRNPFKCDLCEEIFYISNQFKEHILKHPNYLKCSTCSKQFMDQKLYDQHKKIHKNTSFVCEECGKQYKAKSQLNAHFKVKHLGFPPRKQDQTKKNHLCTLCGMVFIRPSRLKQHTDTVHKGIKAFPCDECGNRFSSKVHLHNHMRTHTGERPFACEICGKRFADSNYLKIHKRFHTGDRPYKCSYCEKGFTTKGDLKTHERTHTGVKLYECKICNKSFTTSHYLKVHSKKHEIQTVN